MVVELVKGGPVINGATQSSFIRGYIWDGLSVVIPKIVLLMAASLLVITDWFIDLSKQVEWPVINGATSSSFVCVFLSTDPRYTTGYTTGRTAARDQFSPMDGFRGTCAQVTNLDPMLACGESALCSVQSLKVQCTVNSEVHCSSEYRAGRTLQESFWRNN